MVCTSPSGDLKANRVAAIQPDMSTTDPSTTLIIMATWALRGPSPPTVHHLRVYPPCQLSLCNCKHAGELTKKVRLTFLIVGIRVSKFIIGGYRGPLTQNPNKKTPGVCCIGGRGVST